jgi:preprotein translocase subunit YajC
MSFFISPAYADAVGGAAGQSPSLLGMLLPLGLIAIMFFMVVRPQQKRAKEQQALVSALAKGDEVVFAGGLLGRITRLDDDYVVVEIKDGVEIKVQRATVTATLPKGTLKNI